MKLLQINTTVNTGSTGRITEDIGRLVINKGHESYIAYSRKGCPSKSQLIQVGSKLDMYIHGLYTRASDRHGFASKRATKDLISKIDDLQPDIIGLHNIHGYYLHVGELFRYLKENQHIPVIWTFHDCWPFTGHCAYYSMEGCLKWKTHCENCPLTHKRYPKSLFLDKSYSNFEDKRNAFTGHQNLTIITPSKWLKNQIAESFLKDYPVEVIYNGIDLNQFRILNNQELNEDISSNKKVLLGVASVWEERKGLFDFIELSKKLSENYKIVLIGLDKEQLKDLPASIKGIPRTDSIEKLVEWYNIADVFVNPTYEDNFPTTNIEAIACGTPVITYKTGGSPEAICEQTGMVVSKGDINKLKTGIEKIVQEPAKYSSYTCRKRAEDFFSKEERFLEYYDVYQATLN